MAMFDNILDAAKSKLGIGGEGASGLLAALLAMLANPAGGGFGGFLDKFRNAGLGDKVDSWVKTGDNTPLTEGEVESALGGGTLDSIASQAGVDRGTAAAAMSGMIPSVVDQLTPDGSVPDEESLLSKIGGFLSGWGGAAGAAVLGGAGAAAAMAGGAADKVGDAAGAAFDKTRDVAGRGGAAVTGAAGAVGGAASGAVRNVAGALDRDGGGAGGVMKWLLPLVLLGLLVALGFWFCNRGAAPTGNAVNANANSNARPNTNAGANNTSAANTAANANAAPRTLSEVMLPNGTKLQAYPGGIEDQMIKFIQSADYKNATPDALKDKWFSFDDLNFVFGKTELTPQSKRQVDNIVAILKAFPDVKLKIGGYTDKKGDDNNNLKLSDSRAKAVQAVLQKAGVAAQVPEAEGYGEKFATVDEAATDEARQVDRKTAVRLIKGDAKPAAANTANTAPAGNTNANAR